MSHARELLDLAAAGDERGLKRAYARLLKQTRPDEDPAGFQRLHDLYQRALAQCHAAQERDGQATPVWGDTEAEIAIAETAPITALRTSATSPINVTATPAVAPIDLALPAQPDPDKAVIALLRAGAELPPEAFPSWLQKESREWSLDTLDAVGACLLSVLRHGNVAMQIANMHVLYRFFRWDDVASGANIHELQWLSGRAYAAWLQLPPNHGELAALLPRQNNRRMTQREVGRWLEHVQRPHSHLDNLLAALPPRAVNEMRTLLTALGCRPGAPLPPGIDAGQASFWSSAGNPLHRSALQLMLIRSVMLGVGLMMVGWVIANKATSHLTPTIGLWLLGALLLPPAFALFVFAQDRLYAYQLAPETDSTPRPWLRVLTIPLLVAAAAACWPLLSSTPGLVFLLGWPVAWKVLRLAQIRSRWRQGKSLEISGGALFLMLVPTLLLIPAWVGAVGYWALDLYRHRGTVRWLNE